MVGPKPHSVLREQFKPMPDPDLEISGGGGGNTDPEIRGVPGHGLLVWSKNKGGGPPGPFRWICHCVQLTLIRRSETRSC